VGEITTLFWDVGGVLLTNGWDHAERRRAAERFALDPGELEARHALLVDAFETDAIGLADYLRQAVFYAPRAFSANEFREFMFAQSRPFAGLEVARDLARTRRYRMAALNNESLELNVYRIRQFGLREHFDAFYSSCFVAARKPAAAIFERVLQFTQREPGECLMIDDRAENLEAPARLGMRVIRFESPQQLRRDLAGHGVECQAAA
jgi:putative hydrolase of the HAD superfamily